MRNIKNFPFCWQEKKALSLIRDNFKKSQLPLAISLYVTITEQASYFGKDTFNIFWIKLIEQSWIWYKSFRDIMNKFIDLKILKYKKWELTKIPLTQEFIYWESEIVLLEIELVQTCTEPCTEPCTHSGQSNKKNKEELKEEIKKLLNYWNSKYQLKNRYTDNLFKIYSKIRKKHKLEDIEYSISKYNEYISNNKWYTNRFSLYDYLNQWNWLEKFFNS